jgi:uncharacterized protein YodC (DUF2158 family)
MENFSVGDTVQLKSGGPIMTVDSVDYRGVNCIWFVNETTPSLREYILLELLKKVESEV